MCLVLKTAIHLVVAILMLAVLCPAAYCHYMHREMHLEIDGDHIYVVPRSGLFKKIEKTSGRPIWTSKAAKSWGDSYTTPVFINNRFITIGLNGHKLYSVDCETGHQAIEHEYDIGCTSGNIIFEPLLCGDLFLTFTVEEVQALRLGEKSPTWRLSCSENGLLGVYDYFQTGDTIHILMRSSADRSINWEDALRDENLHRFEIVELDCQTGDLVNRYDKSVFFGDSKDKIDWIWEIGEWHDKRLILLKYTTESGVQGTRLFAFDPTSKSAMPVVGQPGHPSDDGRLEAEDFDFPKPDIMGDIIVYWVRRDAAWYHLKRKKVKMLMAKNLQDGETLWTIEMQNDWELPYATTEDTLFTFSRNNDDSSSAIISCRNAIAGELIWSKEIKFFDQYSYLYEMKVSGDLLYVLSSAYLRALNVNNGEEIWRVPLWPEEDYAKEPEENTSSRILGFFDDLF
jgi:outer membrane protein assembly factor BamB